MIGNKRQTTLEALREHMRHNPPQEQAMEEMSKIIKELIQEKEEEG